MDSTNATSHLGTPGNPAFPPTHWSVVCAAGNSQSPESAAALEKLCCAYWYPLYAFARGAGHAVEDAKDLVQGFFHELLEKKQLRSADRNRGKFRTFLLAYFESFISNQNRKTKAKKRGGGRIESLDALLENAEDRYRLEPRDDADPAKLFDQAWIMDLVERALQMLKAQSGQGEAAQRFAVLRQFLPGKNPSLSQAEAGAKLGLSENAVNQAVSKMRQDLREILREEIKQTCASWADFEEELRFILARWSA